MTAPQGPAAPYVSCISTNVMSVACRFSTSSKAKDKSACCMDNLVIILDNNNNRACQLSFVLILPPIIWINISYPPTNHQRLMAGRCGLMGAVVESIK